MENKKEIVTHSHKYWNALIYRLENSLLVYQNGKWIAKCDCDLKITRKILKSLPQVDVEGTIEYLQSYGGFCDCEVLMNVA